MTPHRRLRHGIDEPHLAKNHWRERSRRPHESTATVEPGHAPPEADVLRQQVLLPAVMDLPVRQRAVLVQGGVLPPCDAPPTLLLRRT